MSKEFRASNSCIQVESVPLQSVGGGRGCLSKGLVIFFDVSIVNAARRLTIKAAAKKMKYNDVLKDDDDDDDHPDDAIVLHY